MKIIKVIRKNFPNTVLEMKVKDLDVDKCSKKFLSNNLNPEDTVYVKCDLQGEVEYRTRGENKQEYRIFDISKCEIVED